MNHWIYDPSLKNGSPLTFPCSFSKSICQNSQLKMPLWAIIVLFKEGERATVNMSVVYFCWLQGVSNQQRASASATDSKEKKKKKKLHLQKGQISADTSRLFENRVSGSLEFHFHLFILLSLNTIRYLFTHEPFSATFKKTMNHLAVPSPFSVLLC